MSPTLPNSNNKKPYLIIVMGVSGCGKTTIAQQLAKLNALEFIDADDFHSTHAIENMSKGTPLSDKDRQPWIDSMCGHLLTRSKSKINCCLAYSGLRRAHRKRFMRLGFEVIFIHLIASHKIILNHLKNRGKHFMGSELLDSQLSDLEPASVEEPIYEVSIRESIGKTVISVQQVLLKSSFNDGDL